MAIWYVRNSGGTTTQCTGLTNADYDGSGTGEPCAYSSIQDAIDAATWGDTIKLHAGQTFDTPGAFVSWNLTSKGTPPTGTDADYITITTDDDSGTPSALTGYPQYDVRITTAMAANMPRVRTISSYPIFWINANAKYWKIERLNMTNNGPGQTITLLQIGAEGDSVDTISEYPDHIIIQLNWLHPKEEDGTILTIDNVVRTAENAIYVEGTNITIRQNAIQGFVGRTSTIDGPTITSAGHLMTTWADNVTVENNLIEAWTYAVFYGGGSKAIAYPANTATVSSCTSTSCVFSNTTDLAVGQAVAVLVYTWMEGFLRERWGSAYVDSINGSTVNFVNPLCNSDNTGGNGNICMPFDGNNPVQIPPDGNEARWNGYQIQNVTVRRNIFAHRTEWTALMGNNCGGKGYLELKSCKDCTFSGNIFKGCTGATITVRNQGGADPWLTLDNLTVSSNWHHQANNPMVAYLNDQANLTNRTTGVTYTNNLITGEWANPDEFNYQRVISGYFTGGINTTITHNTVLVGSWKNFSSYNDAGRTMIGLVMKDNIFRAAGNACFSGEMSTCWPSAVVTDNVLMHIDSAPLDDINNTWLTPFPDNTRVTSIGAIGFEDAPAGLDATGDYRLAAGSTFKNAASDGTDVGVNYTTLIAALGFDPNSGNPAPGPVTVSGNYKALVS